MNKNNEFYDWYKGKESLVNQARRQVEAADGDPVIWTFAEDEAAEATEDLLYERQIDGIIIKVVPPRKG